MPHYDEETDHTLHGARFFVYTALNFIGRSGVPCTIDGDINPQLRERPMSDIVCKTLAERFEKKRDEGLLDVKFYVTAPDEASYEQICEEVENLYAAMDDLAYTQLSFKDGRGQLVLA